MTTKRSNALALALAAAFLAPSCASSGEAINNHWNLESVGPRMVRAATGYDSSRDASYREHASMQWSALGLTLERHLLNYNPGNPNQVAPSDLDDDIQVGEVPPNPYE